MTTTERGYDGRWKRERLAYLRAHPLCVQCKARGVIRAATVVDHVVPHRGDKTLFWDRKNWSAVCAPCHDSKRGEEKLG